MASVTLVPMNKKVVCKWLESWRSGSRGLLTICSIEHTRRSDVGGGRFDLAVQCVFARGEYKVLLYQYQNAKSYTKLNIIVSKHVERIGGRLEAAYKKATTESGNVGLKGGDICSNGRDIREDSGGTTTLKRGSRDDGEAQESNCCVWEKHFEVSVGDNSWLWGWSIIEELCW